MNKWIIGGTIAALAALATAGGVIFRKKKIAKEAAQQCGRLDFPDVPSSRETIAQLRRMPVLANGITRTPRHASSEATIHRGTMATPTPALTTATTASS